MKRKLHISNGTVLNKIGFLQAHLTLDLTPEWNQLEINLPHLTSKLYGTKYVECLRIHIHPNCRLRRVYFADRSYSQKEMPIDYWLLEKEPELPKTNKKLSKS